MKIEEKIAKIQTQLNEQGLDGWLLYDNHGSNRLVRELLEIPGEIVLTRRFFYWIPKKGEPEKIVHRIEEESLEFLPGKKRVYLSWIELERAVAELLKGVKKIAMEYSPRNANPYISKVDAGTMEVVHDCGVEVFSSADILQSFTSVLTESQIRSHFEASAALQKTVENVWSFISEALTKNKRITEYDVQAFMQKEFALQNCFSEEGPICAVNAHSALPHYIATKESQKEIHPGDFILIDLWCKKKGPSAVYADITRVAVAAEKPTTRQKEIFDIVKTAQRGAIEFVKKRVKEGKTLKGYEVDEVCRGLIVEKGYGQYFTHRTGHSIDVEVHGTGAHFDSLETKDMRKVLPGMCFSVEPGIYLPGEFGVRLESNILIGKADIQVTDQMQEQIECLR